MIRTRVSGIPNVKKKLQKLCDKVISGAVTGMQEGGVLLRDVSVQNAPRFTSNLRNSAYVVVSGKGEVAQRHRTYFYATGREIANFEAVRARALQAATLRVGTKKIGKVVEVGFGADYALKVHEAVGTQFSMGGPRFLANTLQTLGAAIMTKIRSSVKL